MTIPITEIQIEDLINRTDAAKFLGIHVNTLDREAKKSGLRRFKRRGDSRVFFLREEIEGIDLINEIAP